MFGMGFVEILLIAVIAIIALGPEKLPSAMVDIAKFFKKMKRGIDEAKSTLDHELKISELKEEANRYKAQISDAKSTMSLNSLDNLIDDDTAEKTEVKVQKKEKVKREKVSFNKEASKSEDA